MKKIHNKYIVIFLVLIIQPFTGCKKFLNEKVYTEYAPEEFLKTEDGIKKVLIGAYSRLQIINGTINMRDNIFTLSEFPTDQTREYGGGFERDALPFINFQWDPASPFFQQVWSQMYTAVRNANVFLDNIADIKSIPADRATIYIAEARFIRAAAYAQLYGYFGPVPLITTAGELDFEPAKPEVQEFLDFVSTELQAAAKDLPLKQDLTGKATRGVALSVLCKLYLNTRQWQRSADAAKAVIDLNLYQLFSEIENLFAVQNENNKEYIYVFPCINQYLYANNYMPHAFPPNYPILSNWMNFGAQITLYTSFVKTFDLNDRRRKMILTEYTDTRNVHKLLLEDVQGRPLDDSRSFKYTPDPDADGESNGNDIPVIRYADILLSRAEALNELNGPTEESIQLINQVRARAAISSVSLQNFSSKTALRDLILQERGREFFSEGKRREDLIRMDKFISGAQARGKIAKPYHSLYPIPQSEIDANPNLKQNEGY